MNFALYATRKRKGLVQYMDKYYLTWIYTNSMIQVGQFAPLIRNDRDEGDYTELQFLPVTLKPADYLTMFIPFSQMSDEKAESQFYAEGLDDEELRQNWIIEQLENEERDKQVFFDKIYVGHYAVYDAYTYDIEKYTPYPFVDNLFLKSSTTLNSPGSVIYYEQKTRYEGCSLRLKDLAEKESQLRIDPRMKYKFRFLSAQVPEVRDIFLIKGRRYVCEKLTVNFTFDGKSEIIEGEFYPVDESAAAS